MNKAITDGLVLMPPPFSAGLSQWSREDGTPGTATYAGQPNAALVPSDQDFAGCLELQKAETVQRLRYMGQTPIEPGLYLRVTVRIKAVAGNMPSVRIAAYAGRANGSAVSVPLTGPAVALTSYGEVVTVSAIIGSGNRQGVDLVWGVEPVYGHFGLDLTGANGGVVRIDDIVIADVTEVFHRKMIDVVDVRDYGAIGDGTTNDADAFAAADAAADGRTVLVSEGTYRIGGNFTFNNPVRFEGTLSMPGNARLTCTRNYDLNTYAAAFGSELEGFRRGLQTLFYFTDHVVFDLSGRKVDLTAPIDVADLCGLTSLSSRRVLTNGLLNAASSPAWDSDTVTSVATYSPGNASRLTNVANVANIPVGARVSGTGVGREVYVREKNVGAGTVTLSAPLWGAEGTRTFTFTRYKYLLDFSGFDNLARFEITDIDFGCSGRASAIMLAKSGLTFRIADCVFTGPKDRGITSIGSGCQGMIVDQCQFLSDEQAMAAQNRNTIALNSNANDLKLRDNRVVRFASFAVMGGNGNMFIGNHFFGGDDQTDGLRQAGIVLTNTNCKTIFTGNYIDNCWIEWSNEHDPAPEFASEFSFGALTLTGNIFTANDVSAAFRWLVIRPRGPGHFINGLSVTGNVFRLVNASIDRVEKVDTSQAGLDHGRARNITFDGNTFNGVSQVTMSPVTVGISQNTAAATWTVDAGGYFPFGGYALACTSVQAEGALRNGANSVVDATCYAEVRQGGGEDRVALKWSSSVKGKALVTIRCDSPN
ncbi:right-handed parallel beta-helix repeat-containing protein [Gemmobacter lutimaris]|uniref:Right-handed parallel beta-helix repeat-containing protein n=1 Tax=Gemmobacter lutimaris TaxID=2306023 RepID=A0A398BSY4_9RHOB|nr:glycosyl hydrolase family 28-related protein [Gemmobacter lutimaris]RID92784.1 right-handed parallel beta-helix repeat-containing protein [Gemmobacter lutimaris]